MPPITCSVCWALALMLLALANATGLVADDVAQTLFVVLPFAAILSLQGRVACGRRGAV
jgi:hypothetical protein